MKLKQLAVISTLLGILVVFTILPVQAQTPTTTKLPSLITPSVTATPIVSITETVAPTPTATPTESAETAGNTINAVVTIGTQSPWNKKIPVKISITSKIAGEKLVIRWQKKAGLVAEPNSTIISLPQANKTYTETFQLTPYSTGYQRAVADIILIGKTTNLVISKDATVQLDSKKVVTPITPMYTFYLVAMYLFIFLVFFVLIPYGIYKGFMFVKVYVFPKWLESKIQKSR